MVQYVEPDGAFVTLHVIEDEMSMKRMGSWTTLGSFVQDGASQLNVVSKEGTLTFNVDIIQFDRCASSIYVHYHLKQGEEIVDTHRFECSWETEE